MTVMTRLTLRLVGMVLLFVTGVAQQADAQARWRLVEELRIGSEADGQDGFADIRGVLEDRTGKIWVLEGSTQEIRIFDSTGRHLKTVGRRGAGPGEFQGAAGIALAPDGAIWVEDGRQGRFSVFDAEGRFLRQHLAPSAGYTANWFGGIDGAGRVWDRLLGSGQPRVRYRRWSPDWRQVDTVATPTCGDGGPQREPLTWQFRRGMMMVPFQIGPAGHFDHRRSVSWCAPSSAEYRIVGVHAETGDTVAVLTGHTVRVPVSEAERASRIERAREFSRRNSGGEDADWSLIPRTKPLIEGLFADREGRVWVRRAVPDAPSMWDIHDERGRLLASVPVPFETPTYRGPFQVGDRFYLVAQEQGEVPHVVRLRLERR